ncbi:aminopeptidase N [Oryzomonas japonica]|uniref:Aminopeptidase N n=1 Tax=Oryzomonas japonica TaxID=2603858 RepID=A0A7J4ZMX8_9BACT|nr:aminopeptidase N [Oryzomonas japonica]KAB0663879.1 aminopeptidase N [Oryzomonas japonica]
MTETAHTTIHRHDYRPPDYTVESVDLRFELGEDTTLVRSRLALRAAYDRSGGERPLVLDGHRFVLRSLSLDGTPLAPEAFQVSAETLVVPSVPASFTLEVETELRPQDNTFLEGLYRSNGMFCTQCEAQGFRSITYYPDRPDVLSIFTVTVVADRERYPVLLSNGNPLDRGELPDGRHFITWHDPFRKPSYLFALVAGRLACIEDSFTTCSGREVSLRLYLQEANRNKGGHALRSLKKAMRWDEETFGREYDLDCYMIVAVDDFNMGAMENKGLNIFNSCYVLATPETATDTDYQAIEEVIGHEYFHNWSGNRVTCRDWFQLSLKEGLTIFRDQEFSADMESRGVKRIADVRYLRTAQFAEDGGPLAHPVRPESYMEINNFYTATVYNKGGELIRMLRTLLGAERFRKGMDLYFERHDGQAVTIEDFVQAMADASNMDLGQFRLWYSQAGTPLMEASSSFEAADGVFTLTVRQSCPPTPGQPDKQPFHIPLVVGLLDRAGRELPVTLFGEPAPGPTTRILEVNRAEQTFHFSGLDSEPVPALLRGYSAPVKLDYPYRPDDLVLLMAHETDPFCRWEAGQQLAAQVILSLVADQQAGRELKPDQAFVAAYRAALTSGEPDRAFLAEALTLPSEKYLAELMPVIDPEAIHIARRFMIHTLATQLRSDFLAVREACRSALPYGVDDGRSGERRLANLCLAYLMSLEEQAITELCIQQYRTSDNMTDTMGALGPLASCDCPERSQVLEDFYRHWQGDRLVVDKWFSLRALSDLPGTLDDARALIGHPAFELANPNRFRALVGAFSQNQPHFHAPDGAGYRFLVDQLLRLIPLNPQVSARLLAPLTTWRRFEPGRQALMQQELRRIQALPQLPRDVYEVVEKSL